jgi:hypothetical protein
LQQSPTCLVRCDDGGTAQVLDDIRALDQHMPVLRLSVRGKWVQAASQGGAIAG